MTCHSCCSSSGYRPAAGSLAEAESQEGAKLLVEALLSAFPSLTANAGVLVADHSRAKTVSLQNPWFHHHQGKGQENKGMYC